MYISVEGSIYENLYLSKLRKIILLKDLINCVPKLSQIIKTYSLERWYILLYTQPIQFIWAICRMNANCFCICMVVL